MGTLQGCSVLIVGLGHIGRETARVFSLLGADVVAVNRSPRQAAGVRATYPVEWTVSTPANVYTVKAVIDNQELDSRQSTGAVYWEGLSELTDDKGQRVGSGYLEMTGYAQALRL